MRKDKWLIIVALALLAILLVLFFIGSRSTVGDTVNEPVSMTEPIETPEDTGVTITDGEDEAAVAVDDTEYITVPLDEFKEYADSSSGMWEFIQRFFKDVIVYKNSAGKYVYEPVNKNLPLSNYNWSNLKEVGLSSREVEYVVDGQTVSIKGIDVSKYQEEIDWEKVAASGVKFAIIRLGYRGYSSGDLVLDERFEYNVEGALRNNIAVGVYFVTQAVSDEEAVEEAEFVLNAIAPYNVTWPIVLDLEDAGNGNARTALLTSEERTDYVRSFCERIKQGGKKPMLYFNICWLMEKLDITRLADYDKWFAQYFNIPFFPYEFQMWQYTSTGKIDGIKGNVDFNISFVDYSKGE
ncbi:MAG: glycoside hydrolase family 25 protein [Clostridia bacterium]|nr:glycoside hydrolase family 25 protein [Clostridia bacterium]